MPFKNNSSDERHLLLERPKICNDQGALQLEGCLARVLERNSTFERLRTEQCAASVSRCTGIDWTWHLWAPRNQQIQVPPGCLLCQPAPLTSSGRFLGLPTGRLTCLTILFLRSVDVNEAATRLAYSTRAAILLSHIQHMRYSAEYYILLQ